MRNEIAICDENYMLYSVAIQMSHFISFYAAGNSSNHKITQHAAFYKHI
jgi:hypothetical protein